MQLHSLAPIQIRAYKHKHWGSVGISPEVLQDEQRSTIERQVRIHLMRGQSLLLQTPRWSGVKSFLATIDRQLQPTEGRTQCRWIPLQFSGRDSEWESWQKVLQSFRYWEPPPPLDDDPDWEEILQQEEDSKLLSLSEQEQKPVPPLKLITGRVAFRWSLREFFEDLSQEASPPHALLLTRVERWPLAMLEDLQQAWLDSLPVQKSNKVVPLILAGAISGGLFSNALWLRDYTTAEALKRIAVDNPSDKLKKAIWLSGGIPDLIHTLVDRRGPLLNPDEDSLRLVWGRFMKEIRVVLNLISAQQELQDRLFQLSYSTLPTVCDDLPLKEVGLVRANHGVSMLRAPLIGRLIRS